MAESPPRPATDPLRAQKQPTAGYSPTAGCIIFAIGGAVILVLVSWFLYAGYKQTQEVRNFTSEQAETWVLPAVSPEEHTVLTDRLAAYAAAMEAHQAAEVSLSVEEMNALLASDPTLESVRRNVQVQSIGERVVARASLPINNPFGSQRYLNGVIEFMPVVKPATGLALQTESITVAGQPISEGFLHLYREMNFLDDMLLKGFREHPTLGPPFKGTTSVALRDGRLVVSYVPAAK
jgi:hypothetical protein